MVKSKRKKGEKFESFLRRHNQNVIRSGNSKLVRFNQFFSRSLNKLNRRRRVLFGKKLEHDREYLQKIGKFKEEDKHRRY